MNFKLYITTLLVLAICFTSFGQQPEMERLDKELTLGFQEMITADYDLRYDSLAPSFIARLKTELSQIKTIDYPFDSLSSKIKILQSSDKKLRTYSWDEKSGGSWHDMAAIAQFVTDDGQVNVQQLDSGEEGMTGGYTDVIIYEIHEVMLEGEKHYLTIGWGTHGSGHHHSAIQIFRIEGEELLKYVACFENNTDLVVVAPRRDKINLKFNRETLEITHNKFEYDREIGFYRPTGNNITLKLIDGLFQVQ